MSGTAGMRLLADAELSASFLPLALVLCAVTISLLLLRRRVRNSVDPRVSGQEMLERFRRQARVADSLDGMAIQLEELARRVSAQVDTRFAKLESVIRDADERIARLEALLAEVDRSGEAPPPAAAGSGGSPTPAVDASRGQPPPAVDGGRPPPAVDGGQPPPAVQPRRRNRRPPRETSDAVASISAVHERVLSLRRQGHGAEQIARELDLPLGEVEVILNLADPGG